MSGRRRPAPILAGLALSALLAVLVFRVVVLRTDMADFLPAGQTDAARFMLRELREGAATSVILIGIENAAPDRLAAISRAITAALQRSGRFSLVSNGQLAMDGEDERFLFAHRYLLSPLTTAEAFSEASLAADLRRLLNLLRSSASPLAERYGMPDPPGAFIALLRGWIGQSALRTVGGVWFAADRERALILARTSAGGMDITAQEAAAQVIDASFAAAGPGTARLLVAGPAIFARRAAAAIRGDIELLSTVSTVLVAGLLLWRFRSIWVLAAIGVTVLASLAAAAAAVQLVFGYVHGVAFGFGMTMLGVTVDYPVLLIGHRDRGEPASGTLGRIGPSLILAVLSAAIGMTGMLFSGFPGLAQLGLFAVVGILVAALATRFVLPPLIVAADLGPAVAGDPRRLLRIEHWRAGRAWLLLPLAAAVAILLIRPPRMEDDLARLTPVPAADLALDAALRGELGAPDVGQVVVVRASSADAVLAEEEKLAPTLARLRDAGQIAAADYAARSLPSVATQRARQAALPSPDILLPRIAAAQAGLAFRADAFAAFAAEVEAQRVMAPLQFANLASPLLAARLQPLLFERDGAWFGLVAVQAAAHPGEVARAFAGETGVTVVDMRGEANGIVARYTAQALRWLAYGAIGAVLALAVGLRDPRRLMRVVASVAAASLITVALLAAARVRLSLIHIVALQFVAGVGLDYALFFARPQLDQAERARTLRTLLTCNAMTLLTFGLLAFCRTPLLRDIGITVASGALCAMLSAFFLAAPPPTPE